MRRRMTMGMALIALVVPLLAQAASAPKRSVMVGGSTSAKACPSTGKIRAAVTVRTGPGGSESAIDSLQAGHIVNLCEPSSDGRWIGVVYQPREKMDRYWDCQVSSPGLRRPYNGPCRSGWVERSAIAS